MFLSKERMQLTGLESRLTAVFSLTCGPGN